MGEERSVKRTRRIAARATNARSPSEGPVAGGVDARTAFDPANPFDAMAESIRRATVEVLIQHQKTAVFSSLPLEKQFEAFLAGSMTAVVGCCLTFVTKEGRDDVERCIAEYVGQARVYAEEIMDDESR